MDIKALIEQVKDGTLSLEEMKELKAVLQPESEAARVRRETQATLNTYLDLTLEEAMENGEETIRDVYDNAMLLAKDVKGKRSQRLATKKWSWPDRKDRTGFKIDTDYGEVDVNPKNDSKWIPLFIKNGYTEGQLAAVRKERPYRKALGILTMDQLADL